MRTFKLITVTTLAVLTLTACGASGWSEVQDAGINISYKDYHDLCDVRAGETKPGMNVTRTWAQSQTSELNEILRNDPRCQSDE